MGSLLVITGPPGAGKTTVARIVAERAERSVLVEGDAFFGFLARGAVEPWLPQARRQNETVVDATAAATGRFVRGGYVTVYDGIIGPWFLDAFTRATGVDRLGYVVLMPSVERCVQRVATRLDHGFADEGATRSMHDAFAGAEVDPKHVLVDPPEDPVALADLVAGAHARGALDHHLPAV